MLRQTFCVNPYGGQTEFDRVKLQGVFTRRFVKAAKGASFHVLTNRPADFKVQTAKSLVPDSSSSNTALTLLSDKILIPTSCPEHQSESFECDS